MENENIFIPDERDDNPPDFDPSGETFDEGFVPQFPEGQEHEVVNG